MPAVYVLSFEDYQPSARFDRAPWTQIQIGESSVQGGPFTLIDTLFLSPVDADPAQPAERSFTTEKATMAAGWYQITFVDDAGGTEPTEPVYNSAARSGYTPGVGDVGALLRARTKDSSGNELGSFTDKTRPTRDQVERLIEQASMMVVARLGADPDPSLWEAISGVIALSTAMRVEISFFPEQVAANRSPYAELKALRDEDLAALVIEDPTATAVMPVFATPCIGLRSEAPTQFPGWPWGPDEWDWPWFASSGRW